MGFVLFLVFDTDFFLRAFSSPVATFQLFRRVAAALPGMDSTPEKSKEDSILVFSTIIFWIS